MIPKVAFFGILLVIPLQKDPIHHDVNYQDGERCDIIYDGIDLRTKKYRREIAPAKFFVYTPLEVKNELKEDNLMECSLQFLTLEEKNYLNLNIKLNSLLAKEQYGRIAKGNLLTIKLINGKSVKLKCASTTRGQLNQSRNAYIYAPAFELPQYENKTLLRQEIDKVGIQWSSGYEEYVVYELDLIMNQLSCLIHKN